MAKIQCRAVRRDDLSQWRQAPLELPADLAGASGKEDLQSKSLARFNKGDTEGSELEILRAFDFDRYDVNMITVEYKDTLGADFFELLRSKGFVRIYATCSQVDDWYVKQPAAMKTL